MYKRQDLTYVTFEDGFEASEEETSIAVAPVSHTHLLVCQPRLTDAIIKISGITFL